MHLSGERKSAQPQIVGLNTILLAQLVAALDDGPVRSAIGDNPNLRFARRNLRPGHERARGFKLTIDPLHVVLKAVWRLTVLGLFVMPAATSEGSGGGVVSAWQGAVTNAVAVHILVTGEAP